MIKNEALLDREAVRQILAGRPAAFNDIVHRHGPALFRLAFQYLGNREEAEEQCQEILLKAFSRLDRYDPERRFFTWLYTIAVNHLRSEHRKRKIRKVRLPAAAYFESPFPNAVFPAPRRNSCGGKPGVSFGLRLTGCPEATGRSISFGRWRSFPSWKRGRFWGFPKEP